MKLDSIHFRQFHFCEIIQQKTEIENALDYSIFKQLPLFLTFRSCPNTHQLYLPYLF